MLSGDLKSRPPVPDNILLASFGVSVMCFSLGPLCKSRHWSFTRKLKCGYYNRYIGEYVRLALADSAWPWHSRRDSINVNGLRRT